MGDHLMPDAALQQDPAELAKWFLRGACGSSGLPTDAWFDKNPRAPISMTARAVCGRCAVRAQCLRDALTFPDTVGIWGGLDEYERKELLEESRRD